MLFSWVKASKLRRPWYWPMPEAPTPPNPMREVARWMMVSLTQPPPKETEDSTWEVNALSEVNRYSAKGCGRR